MGFPSSVVHCWEGNIRRILCEKENTKVTKTRNSHISFTFTAEKHRFIKANKRKEHYEIFYYSYILSGEFFLRRRNFYITSV